MGKQVNQLPLDTSLEDGDQLLLEDTSNVTKKTTLGTLSAKVRGDMTATDVETALTYTPADDAAVAKKGAVNSFTEPQSFINAASQIQFGTAADQGFLTGVAGGAFFSFGMKWTGAAYEARKTAAFSLFAGTNALAFYGNTGLTIGNTFSPAERMRLTTNGLLVGTSTDSGAKIDANGMIRSIGDGSPTSGAGPEMRWDGSTAHFQGYNRGGAAWVPVLVRGSTVGLVASGTTIATATSTALEMNAPVDLKTYTTATRPSHKAGRNVYDTTIGKPIYSNGTGWTDGAGTAV